MKAYYIVCVILYYLFGYLFLPGSICATPGYILGAFLFPFVLDFVIDHVLHRKENVTASSRDLEELEQETLLDDKDNTDRPEEVHPDQLIIPKFEECFAPSQPPAIEPHDRQFEIRFYRAKNEPLTVTEYLDSGNTKAVVENMASGHRYVVTGKKCECGDFAKRKRPCKHMIYLAIENGTFEEMKAKRQTLSIISDSTDNLMYPGALIHFEELSSGGHEDPRALVHILSYLNWERKMPFTMGDLYAPDFDSNKQAFQYLVERNLIEALSQVEEIEASHTKADMVGQLLEKGLATYGGKRQLAERLVNSGYKIDRRIYRKKYFRITEHGKNMIRQRIADRQEAINMAVRSIKGKDYMAAVLAYRQFDSKWGFLHPSGEAYTIFADFDVDRSRFVFLQRYPMPEIKNSLEFKNTLRACMIAGLMRGEQTGHGVADDVMALTQEQIRCDDVVKLYESGEYTLREGTEKFVRAAMRENAEQDNRYVLSYYISHILYLARNI